ncbi:hypothetical protein [Geomonas anaerohicana]|uniref:Uncharacterized protein n=1 Tax=Geomonas anaerohicana TaxID=2798583 RepID=A0ABS0YKM2_9BACT|nr:hypothetical protein [Geomonas anaerohicana]MBJ6752860.1 hypothetical protein [Geomonas anaerohicana]
MKRTLWCLLGVLLVATFIGCGGGGGAPAASGTTGAVSFQIDLASLQQNGTSAAKSVAATTGGDVTITNVIATLSRDGYPDQVKPMTVTNNVATGTVNDLAQGYWHVSAQVFSGDALLYVGAVDVKVIAGAQVAAEILFDPAPAPDSTASTGTLSLTVGLNKYPGYTKIRQFVTSILEDKVDQKYYIFDSSAKTVAVYNANTLIREKDIVLQSAPQALAVEASGGSLLLGYSTGKIYRLKVADESLTYLADSLISVTALVPISSKFVLVANGSAWGPSNTYETINLENGQIASTKSYWYPLSDFTYNPAAGVAYALDSGLSPADMHRLALNTVTGSIDNIVDSRYHGSYTFGSPIRAILNGTRVVTGSGNMFVSSSSASDDITYTGNLGHPFIDLVSDDALGNIYMLNSDNIRKLLVIKQDSLFTALSLDLIAEPKRIFDTGSNIVVFAKPDDNYYAKVFSKSALGLI